MPRDAPTTRGHWLCAYPDYRFPLMKTIRMAVLFCLLAGVPTLAQNAVGDWQGTLDANGTTLRVVVHITQSEGGYRATLDSPDQGANGIPVGSVSVAGSALKFEVPMVGGSYEGHFSADGQTVDGTWSQGGMSLALVLKRQTAAASAPAPPPARVKKPGEPVFLGEETWQGALDAGMATFHLVLHLAKAGDGGLVAAIDSVDQNAYGITVSSATEKDGVLKLALPGIGASYEGHIAAGRATIDGTWSQGERDMPLVFTRSGAAPAPPAPAPAAAAPAGTVGIWQGVLEAGGAKLRLQLHVFAAEKGQFTGKLDSLDQGANGLVCANITLKENAFHFDVPSVGGSYEGKLNAAGAEIAGSWTQGGVTRPLNFKLGDKPIAWKRPQNPTEPYPYRTEEVSFPNTKAGVALAGTLSIPPGLGPFPAALLISGSGPNTRDEFVAGHSIFLVLADSLTRRGIVVLRFDKRGIGKSSGNYAAATSADFADDAEAGVAFLKSRKEVNPREIGLVGHSEGGIIAPMVASRSRDVAWIVLLAGDAVKGEEVLVLQGKLIDNASGMSEERAGQMASLQRKSLAIIHQEKDDSVARQKLTELYETDPTAKEMPAGVRQMSVQFLLSPWMRYFLDYDPAPALERTKCPVLALYGSKDLQVPPSQNLPVMKAALSRGGNKDFRAEVIPDLNHLFQHATTGSPNEYGGIEETMAPVVLDDVSSWILKHASS